MSKWGSWVGIGVTFGVACLVGLTGYADPGPAAAERSSMPRELTAAELATLDRAEDILISRCMKQRGFTFVPTRKPAADDRTFRYVIDDVGWAREHGFGSEDRRRMAKAVKNDPNQQYFRRLPPERQRAALAALNGDRPEGLSAQVPLVGVVTANDQSCRADAQRRLYGDLATWFRVDVVVSNLTAGYVPKVEKDPRFTKAVADWGRCMRRAGHPYESPNQLREALDRRMEMLDHAHEVRLAVAEAQCSRSTALAETARELDRYYGDQARDQTPAAARHAAASPQNHRCRLLSLGFWLIEGEDWQAAENPTIQQPARGRGSLPSSRYRPRWRDTSEQQRETPFLFTPIV